MTFSPFGFDEGRVLPGPVAPLDDVSFAALTWARLVPLIPVIKSVRVSPDGGVNFPDGPRTTRSLRADVHPAEPATITVGTLFNSVLVLVADFDVSKAEVLGIADPVAQVARDAAAFVALMRRCGAEAGLIHDISPSGGRHVLVKFQRAIPVADMARLGKALQLRFITFDKAPIQGALGQIRPPGSPHKRSVTVFDKDGKARSLSGPLTGYHTLTMPLEEAVEAMARPVPPRVWTALQTDLYAELQEIDGAVTFSVAQEGGQWAIDGEGVKWVHRRGGRRQLTPVMAVLAATGDWSTYVSSNPLSTNGRSEARLAVLNAAVWAGWRLAEVLAEAVPGGAFAGLDELLGDRSAHRAKQRLLGDWNDAVTGVASKKVAYAEAMKQGRRSDINPTDSTAPPLPQGEVWTTPRVLAEAPDLGPSVWARLYAWSASVYYAERDPVRCKGWGPQHTVTIRLVLRALLVAHREAGSTTAARSVRGIALGAGVGVEAARVALETLREEQDPLVDLVARARPGFSDDADTYELRLPKAYRREAIARPWRAGRIESGHPAFLGLGKHRKVAALLYETLSATIPMTLPELEAEAALSASSVKDGLRTLGEVGLAVKHVDVDGRRGWIRGPVSLDEAAVRDDVQGDVEFDRRVAAVQAQRSDYADFLDAVGGDAQWDAIADRLQDDAPDVDDQDPTRQDPTCDQDPMRSVPLPREPRPDFLPDAAAGGWTGAGQADDPLAWMWTPAHQAAMEAVAQLGERHPMVAAARARRTRPKPRPRRRTAPRPIPPEPPVTDDGFDAVLQLLADELGAVVLEEHDPPPW